MKAKELIENAMIKKGDFFTVVKWISHHDNSYKGDCFEAKVIDYPFVRAYLHDGMFANTTITLNLEQVNIMPLSKEFVDSVLQGDDTAKEETP